jgi:GR25 family glycosyltransferase involved in LPS biosynthesis
LSKYEDVSGEPMALKKPAIMTPMDSLAEEGSAYEATYLSVAAHFSMNDKMTANKPFEKIFVINLNRSIIRMNNMKQMLQDQNLDFERFEAVDGREMQIYYKGAFISGKKFKDKGLKFHEGKHYALKCDPTNDNPTSLDYFATGRKLSVGELGIWCSSVKLWKHILDEKYDNVVVFEDDIRITSHHFEDDLSRFINRLPPSFEIGWLDSYSQERSKRYNKELAENMSNLLFRKTDNYWLSMHAYIISKHGIEKMFNDSKFKFPVACPIDVFLGAAAIGDFATCRGIDFGLSRESYISTSQILKQLSDIQSDIWTI